MRISSFAAATFAVVLIWAGSAIAAPPTNDAFADASTIASLPTGASVDLTEATLEGGEPGGGCWPMARTAWYRLQPASDMLVRFATTGVHDRTFNVYRDSGSGIGGLSFAGCAYSSSDVVATLQGGSTYYVQLGAPPWSGAGFVGLDVTVIDPPPNDDFGDAFAVGSLPYSTSVDARAATLETGEPTQPSGVAPAFTATAWWSFTPSQTGSVMISNWGCCSFGHNVAVYTGGAVDALTEVPVTRPYTGRIVFTAIAGTTYRVQSGVAGNPGSLGITFEATPLPSVGMWVSPFDPSIYDTVSFQANTWDPTGIGIDSYTWDFGDGAGATGPGVSHRFEADGDYAVRLTVTTPDGRSNSSTTTVSVRTRDVAITKLSVPQSARVGQTRTLTVGLTNNLGPETVTVTLYRSHPGGGWDYVGQSVQLVQGRTGNRTTSFVFAYTFTPDDGAVGKVTFRAVATISSGRDALPGDNEVIALPTTVAG